MPDPSSVDRASSAELALAVYLEELARGRRVLWLGSESNGARRIAAVARTMRVLTGEPAADASRGRGRRRSRGRPRSLDLGGPFDLVVVPDIESAAATDPARIAELAGVLDDGGVLVASASASGEVGYDELFSLVSAELRTVKMLGQAPFAGWAVVDFDATDGDAADVTLDGSLVSAEQDRPERYVAVGASDRVNGDAYAVVRVPFDLARSARVEPTPVEKYAGRIDDLEKQLASRREEIDAANEHAEGLEEDLAQRSAGLERLRAELDEARAAREIAEEALVRASAIEASEAARTEDPVEATGVDVDVEVDVGAEHERLERALATAGTALRDANAEVERRGTLVRDMVEEIRELRDSLESIGPAAEVAVAASAMVSEGAPATAPEELVALRAERDRAVARALDAEAARSEAQFAVDELMGRLVDLEQLVGQIADREAELEGRAKGLAARLAEQHELRDREAARRALAEDDIVAAQHRIVALQREAHELREHLELEIVRAHGDPAEDHGRAGLEERLAEALAAARALEDERDHARADALRLTALVVSTETRLEGAARGYEIRIAELIHDAAIVTHADPRETAKLRARADELDGRVAGLTARLADREAALEAARAPAVAGASAQLGNALDEADRLRDQLAQLNERESDLVVRLADAEELAELEANRANDLSSIVASRDALVGRLQMDLADEERRSREGIERADRFRDENERLREAVVAASERVSEAETKQKAARELEETLGSALTRAETSSSRVASIEDALRDTRRVLLELGASIDGEGEPRFGTTSVGIESPEGEWREPGTTAAAAASGEKGALDRRIKELEREAIDRDTLMRSLAAQLEERDDRLHALERAAPLPSDDESYRAEVMELEGKVARLAEELAHERSARREEGPPRSREAELKQLHEALGDRDAELLVLRGKVSSTERDVKTLREVAAQTRAGLEELLGSATANGDPGTAERIGGLLRILSRF